MAAHLIKQSSNDLWHCVAVHDPLWRCVDLRTEDLALPGQGLRVWSETRPSQTQNETMPGCLAQLPPAARRPLGGLLLALLAAVAGSACAEIWLQNTQWYPSSRSIGYMFMVTSVG